MIAVNRLQQHRNPETRTCGNRFAVMYAGRIVECGDCASVVRTPAHPSTLGLLAPRAGRALKAGERLAASI